MLAAALAVLTVAAAWGWYARADLSQVGLHAPIATAAQEGAVTATWFGVSSLLFDDGETQLLVDGFISRPSLWDVLLQRPVDNDAPMIDFVLHEYGISRLAVIVPVHSHFDHAMDVGAIANRSSASILGSESTANIARGAGVPEDQIVVAEPGEAYAFGQFTVTVLRTLHAPVGLRGEVPIPGSIDEPLELPVPVDAWREGESYSIVIGHPQGTTIVQGSAGYLEGALDGVRADVVMLGVGLLESLGRNYAEGYWQSLVTATGAERVFPVHFEDFTRPFGDIVLPPTIIDDFRRTAAWLIEFRDTWDRSTDISLPVFGRPIVLYPAPAPEA